VARITASFLLGLDSAIIIFVRKRN